MISLIFCIFTVKTKTLVKLSVHLSPSHGVHIAIKPLSFFILFLPFYHPYKMQSTKDECLHKVSIMTSQDWIFLIFVHALTNL